MKATILATLFLTAVTAAQTYTLQQVGWTCGANLAGHVVQTQQGPGIQFGLHSRLENSFAVLVLGHRAPTPINLPGSPCRLFVDARGTMLGTTNSSGNAHFNFRIPPALPIRILFQAVVVDFTPQGRRAASSDVIRLHGQ